VGGNGGRTIQALQPQQVAAVVHDGNRHGPVVLQRFGFGGRGDGFTSASSSSCLVFMRKIL
jgi:hypothetical protein